MRTIKITWLNYWKIAILSLLPCIITLPGHSQNSDHNCILNRTFTNSSGNTYQDEVNYYDGLGRLEQSIIKNSQESSVLVTYQEYDALGRVSNQWLPVTIRYNSGKYIYLNTIKNWATALYEDSTPYSKNIYEYSPLNRVLEQYGPGQDWHDNHKSVVTTYHTNISGDAIFNCKLYQVSGNRQAPTLNQNGNYANGQLYVTAIKDEDGNMSYEFKEKLGQIILTRQIIGNTSCDTYYIYDNFGNLCFVLPPRIDDEGYTQNKLDELAFQYKYDGRRRCIAKKMPGCDWIYYIYDESDRPIFSQDGEQRTKGEWTFSIFDSFNRNVLTGICKNAFDYLSNPLKASVAKAVWKGGTNATKGYTISDVTLIDPIVLSANYYDNYDFTGKNGIPAITDANIKPETGTGYGTQYTGSYKGLQTGTLTAQMNADGTVSSIYLYSVMYYDDRGRMIQSKANNHLPGGTDKEYFAYNFVGQLIEKKHIHSATGKPAQTEIYSYRYDSAGRLLSTTHQLNSNSPVTLISNTYDEANRLKSTIRNASTYLETNYAYNVRSWIKNITGTLFNENLYYNDKRSTSTNSSRYNGNISGMDWKVTNDKERGYDFSYDALSRLIGASYLEDNLLSDKFNTSYSYDKHGNMLSLSRHGNLGTSTYGVVDNLTLVYKGNQLVSIEDIGTNPNLSMSMDFKNSYGQEIEYYYDTNGNQTKDLNKGISKIEYNNLNLPKCITFSDVNNSVNEYVYSASSKKLSVIHKSSTKKRTDYVGNMIYENGFLKRILVDGGYVEDGEYYFYLQDHLGNNRVVAKSDGTIVQTNHYYPYGATFAESTFTDKQLISIMVRNWTGKRG